MIANISGASGSGKTTLVAYLLGHYPFIYQKLTSYTSRHKRPGEKEGVDYYFVDENFFVDKEFVLSRVRSDGFYAVKKADLDLSDDKILLTTFPPKGVLRLEELGYKVKCFYLSVSFQERKKRMLERGDKLIDIEKRLIVDEQEISLDLIKNLLPTNPAFVLDGHKPIDEIALLLHGILSTELRT